MISTENLLKPDMGIKNSIERIVTGTMSAVVPKASSPEIVVFFINYRL